MIKFMQKIAITASFFMATFSFPIFAQSSIIVRKPSGSEYWFLLKQAQDAYENGNYGRSITLAEEAKTKRRDQTAWESYIMEQVQRGSSIRKAGDFLPDVISVLEEQKQVVALGIINNYIEIYGLNYFKNSFSELIKFLNNNSEYPEADYLIGKVYRLEGEVTQSTFYMEKAYKAADKLDVKDVKYDILFDLADMAKNQLNSNDYSLYVSATNKKENESYYTDYEKYLLAVMSDDENFTNPLYMNSLLRIIKNNTVDSVNKFFLIYRSYNDISLKALEGLTNYYNTTSYALNSINSEVNKKQIVAEKEKALKCAALGSVIALSKIQNILEDRITGYTYNGLADLLDRTSNYPDIVEWGSVQGIWELYYNFAVISWECGYQKFSAQLFTILNEYMPVDYWKQKSLAFLNSKEVGSQSLSDKTVVR